jgi:DNA-binding response OmpR family regulator
MSHRILLIENDAAARGAVSRMLEHDGHTVVSVGSATLGLRILEDDHFEIIITDVAIPDTDGMDLLRVLRRMALAAKVVAMSGGGRGGTAGYLELAANLGADATLSKPFSADELREVVTDLMSPASFAGGRDR